jgi:hypothetical protein
VNLSNVLDENRSAVHVFYGDVVEILDGAGNRVGADGILRVADLRCAGRQREVLGVDGVDDVGRSEPLSLKL